MAGDLNNGPQYLDMGENQPSMYDPGNQLIAPQPNNIGHGITASENQQQNYQQKLQSLIAPYQQLAQRFNSPYAILNQNSSLVQNHPRIAGALDSAFLTAALTPGPRGPEGAGGGISRTFQGLLGANDFRRQRAMQAATLPYQMLKPQLEAQDTLAQIDERGKMGEYYANHGAYLGGMLGVNQENANSRAETAAASTLRANTALNTFNAKLGGKIQGKAVNPTVMGLVAKAYGPPGESRSEYNETEAADILQSYASFNQQMQGGAAGNRERAIKGVTEPLQNTKDFITNQKTHAFDDVPEYKSDKNNMNDALGELAPDSPVGKALANKKQSALTARNQRDIDFGEWQASDAPKLKVPFRTWLANKKQIPTSPLVAPQPSASKKWNAQTGRYE